MRIWNNKLKHYVDYPDEILWRELKKFLRYDRLTGFWWWRNAHKIRADHPEKDGYYVLWFKGKKHKAQNLAYFYMTGTWPVALIDHEDRDRRNNRWKNLRPATRSQNAANSKLRKDNKSGLKGVYWNKKSKRWTAQIKFEGKTKTLLNSNCPAVAHFTYLIAADIQFGEFARVR